MILGGNAEKLEESKKQSAYMIEIPPKVNETGYPYKMRINIETKSKSASNSILFDPLVFFTGF